VVLHLERHVGFLAIVDLVGKTAPRERYRMLSQPRIPETVIKPRRADTTRKRRLLPVLTAAKPSRSVMAM